MMWGQWNLDIRIVDKKKQPTLILLHLKAVRTLAITTFWLPVVLNPCPRKEAHSQSWPQQCAPCKTIYNFCDFA